MNNVNGIVDAMLLSPLGCAFLRHAAASNLSPAEIVTPQNSWYLAAFASDDVKIWRNNYQENREKMLDLGPQNRDLAISIVEHASNSHWFKPLDVTSQMHLPRYDQKPTQANFTTPRPELNSWERYAEKIEGYMFTHTYIDGGASIYVATDEHAGDIDTEQKPPYKSWLLTTESNIRVFEVEDANGWHSLCARYPTEGSNTSDSPDFSMDPGRIVPNWHAVAKDWDAVHVSFGAMLLADQVRVESEAGWTYHWTWQIEQTLWLRWAFAAVEPLPEHTPQRGPDIGARSLF